MSSAPAEQTIVFFDGVCHLCNRFVDFIIRQNPPASLKFAPLQGETARTILGAEKVEVLDTVWLWKNGRLYTKSQAVALIFRELGWRWWPGLMLMIPRSIRDFFYDRVARSRYQVFGQSDVCRIPTAEERTHFLS